MLATQYLGLGWTIFLCVCLLLLVVAVAFGLECDRATKLYRSNVGRGNA